jgi:sulfite exporter TauE/SafE
MISFLIAALTLGFLGSFHCLGMCGPIALALPTGKAKGLKKTGLIISYNFGRMITYSFLGLIAGFIGKSFVIAGFQQIFSIVLGIAILSFLLFSNTFPKTKQLYLLIILKNYLLLHICIFL